MTALILALIYLAFMSLGLPDSLLGSAWPTMRITLDVPSSYAGYVSMTISFMTILSSLLAPKLIRKFPLFPIVITSIALTIFGLLGFSFSTQYWMLFLFAIPYGLGAGSIDSALNHYVANHYSSRVMNFLHCFYGLGAIISPNLMALALKYKTWNQGYQWTALLQFVILLFWVASIPLWKRVNQDNQNKENEETEKPASLKEALKTKGVLFTLLAFFCYCSGEAICFLWTPSFFQGTKDGMSENLIASFGSLIFGGLAMGRFIAGLFSNKLGDKKVVRIGIGIEFLGILLALLPVSSYLPSMIGFLLIGTGMGPVYPSLMHMAPIHFGKRLSATVIALQMASAYIGTTFMPMLFGLLQQRTGIYILPYAVLFFAFFNFLFMEFTYLCLRKNKNSNQITS